MLCKFCNIKKGVKYLNFFSHFTKKCTFAKIIFKELKYDFLR